MAKTKLIVALDFDNLETALELVDKVGSSVEWYKVGKQLFTLYGPQTVKALKERGKKVFLDLKFHDIPNTVAQAVRSALTIGADMTNVHASGSEAMLTAAGKMAKEVNPAAILTAVTVLTSMNQSELDRIGLEVTPEEQVVRLAKLTKECGVPGVVCSALEIAPLRKACGEEFVLVVPGIRPSGSSADDQKRIMTPTQAAEAGADYIVVGRPVTKAENPSAAADAINSELASVN